MTQQQMIESIQQIYPDMGETQLRLLLNDALDEFVEETRTIYGKETLTSNNTIENGTFATVTEGNIGYDNTDNTVTGWGRYKGDGSIAYPNVNIVSNQLRVSYTECSNNTTKRQAVYYSNGIYLHKNIQYTFTCTMSPQTSDAGSIGYLYLSDKVFANDIAEFTGGDISMAVATTIADTVYDFSITHTPSESKTYYPYMTFYQANDTSIDINIDNFAVAFSSNTDSGGINTYNLQSNNKHFYLPKAFEDKVLAIKNITLDDIELGRYTGPLEGTEL